MQLTTKYWSGHAETAKPVADIRVQWHNTNRRAFLTGLLSKHIQFKESLFDPKPTIYGFYTVAEAAKFASGLKLILKPAEATILKPGQ
jgi:hypothetical protein